MKIIKTLSQLLFRFKPRAFIAYQYSGRKTRRILYVRFGYWKL